MDALDPLAPVSDRYAALPVAAAFTWDDCAAAMPTGEWYMVAFRSVRRPDADEARLHEYDEWAHQEAVDAPGFRHYFKGPRSADGSCLSFCLWDSRAEARAAAGKPRHAAAVAIVGESYAQYQLEFHRVRKVVPDGALEFSPYDAVAAPEGVVVPAETADPVGVPPAALAPAFTPSAS